MRIGYTNYTSIPGRNGFWTPFPAKRTQPYGKIRKHREGDGKRTDCAGRSGIEIKSSGACGSGIDLYSYSFYIFFYHGSYLDYSKKLYIFESVDVKRNNYFNIHKVS